MENVYFRHACVRRMDSYANGTAHRTTALMYFSSHISPNWNSISGAAHRDGMENGEWGMCILDILFHFVIFLLWRTGNCVCVTPPMVGTWCVGRIAKTAITLRYVKCEWNKLEKNIEISPAVVWRCTWNQKRNDKCFAITDELRYTEDQQHHVRYQWMTKWPFQVWIHSTLHVSMSPCPMLRLGKSSNIQIHTHPLQ